MNPYENLSPNAFWRSGVAETPAGRLTSMWAPKFTFTKDSKVVTSGSCFAQHIGRNLKQNGYGWMETEPVPGSDELKAEHHYGTFSFRTGNVYTARMWNQWLGWAIEPDSCPLISWKGDSGHYDPFRPNVEPGGFATEMEMLASRKATLKAIKRGVEQADIFVFTMGLTECWRDASTGVEFAICPGTLAGEFDPDQHKFHNMGFVEVLTEMTSAYTKLKYLNKDIKVLLTVSPVPLTATASDRHVLNATSHSKSILRAVAGELSTKHDDIDYFPSYEIVTQQMFGDMFYNPNRRTVRPDGVAQVMSCFFNDLTGENTLPADLTISGAAAPLPPAEDGHDPAMDAKCEEELLAAFGTPANKGDAQ